MTDPAAPLSTEAFMRRFGETLLATAAPLFEQAALNAREAGLQAMAHTAGNPPELCLEVKAADQPYASHYRISADTARQCVEHALYFVADGTTRTLEGGLDSINSMVVDTQLATLLRDGFGVKLPTVEARHPAGFW